MAEQSTSGLVDRWLQLRKLVDQTIEAKTLDDLLNVGTSMSELFDFARFLFRMDFSTSPAATKSVVVCNHSTWWCQRYAEMNYQRVDPIARHCLAHSVPIELSQSSGVLTVAGEVGQKFIADAQTAGMRSGFGVPLHGIDGEWGMLLVTSDTSSAEVQRNLTDTLPYVTLLATYLQQAARRIVLDRSSMLPDYNLTKREKECLVWAAEGKTSWETAQILKISERTVIFHLQNAIEKLDVANRTQAVAKASGFILVDPDLSNVRQGPLGGDRRVIVTPESGARQGVINPLDLISVKIGRRRGGAEGSSLGQ